jgi:hypothetical protein
MAAGRSLRAEISVAVIPLRALGLGLMLEDGGRNVRWLGVILGAAGLLVQAVGISTSFPEGNSNGPYEDECWNYPMGCALLVSRSVRRLRHLSAGTPAPVGCGFDRWFVSLSKAGVTLGTIVTGTVLGISAVAFFAFRLRSVMQER